MVVIACSQARDLVGHEPGLCLSRQGWKSVYGRPTGWLKPTRRIEGTDYLFTNENWPQYQRRVASVLITYGRVTSGDPRAVAAAASDFRRNSLGAVGIQLVCDDELTDEQWRSITSRFMVSFQPLVAQFRAFPEQFYVGRNGEIRWSICREQHNSLPADNSDHVQLVVSPRRWLGTF